MCGAYKAYNVTADLCCGWRSEGYVKDGLLTGLKCCSNGIKAYDPKTQTCCKPGLVQDISEDGGG